MGNFLVRYASRVVIYDRRADIRLATGEAVGSVFSKGVLGLINLMSMAQPTEPQPHTAQNITTRLYILIDRRGSLNERRQNLTKIKIRIGRKNSLLCLIILFASIFQFNLMKAF